MRIKAEDNFGMYIRAYLDGVDVTDDCSDGENGPKGYVILLDKDSLDPHATKRHEGHVVFEIRDDAPQDIVTGLNEYMTLRHSIRKEIEKEYIEKDEYVAQQVGL